MRFPLAYQVFTRQQPVRRLAREECDALGLAGPLVLNVREHRWILGPWRQSKRCDVRRGNEIVWSGSRTELAALGVEP